AHPRQNLKPRLAEALEGVGGGARLVGAAAEELTASTLDLFGDGARLIDRLHRARSAHHDDAVAADVDAAGVDDAVVRFRLAADQLVGVRDPDDFLDAGKGLEDLRIGRSLFAGDADGRAVGAGNRMGLEAHSLDVADDSLDLFGPCARFHHYQHDGSV